MTDTVIEFRDVNKWFGNIHVLRDINLAVEMGEVVSCAVLRARARAPSSAA